MGLCKCRTVTNLFCFEHRKNVCERCILSDHPACIVKSYLQWLQDSDFDASCRLCRRALTEAPTIRLTCFDLVHVSCLDSHLTALPPTTAPAGYACPVCQVPVIPVETVQSPLATLVRTTFEAAPWAVPILRGQTKRSGGISATLPRPPSAPLASTLGPMNLSDGELRIEVIEGTPRRPLGGGGRLGRSSLSDPDNDKYGKNRGQVSSSSSWWPSIFSGRLTLKRGILWVFIALALLVALLFLRSLRTLPSSEATKAPIVGRSLPPPSFPAGQKATG